MTLTSALPLLVLLTLGVMGLLLPLGLLGVHGLPGTLLTALRVAAGVGLAWGLRVPLQGTPQCRPAALRQDVRGTKSLQVHQRAVLGAVPARVRLGPQVRQQRLRLPGGQGAGEGFDVLLQADSELFGRRHALPAPGQQVRPGDVSSAFQFRRSAVRRRG